MYNGINSNLSPKKSFKGRNNHQHHNILIIKNNNGFHSSNYSLNKYITKEDINDQKRNLLFLVNNQKQNPPNSLIEKEENNKSVIYPHVNSELCEKCLQEYLNTDINKKQQFIQQNLPGSLIYKNGNVINQCYNSIPIYAENSNDLINQNLSINLASRSNRYNSSYENYYEEIDSYQEKNRRKIKPIIYFPSYNVVNLPIYDIVENNNNRFVELKFIRKKNICSSENKKSNDIKNINEVENYKNNIMNITNTIKNEKSSKSNNNIHRKTNYYEKTSTPFVKNVMIKTNTNQNKFKNHFLNKNKIYYSFNSPIKCINDLNKSSAVVPFHEERVISSPYSNMKNVTINMGLHKSGTSFNGNGIYHYKHFSNVKEPTNIKLKKSDANYLRSGYIKNKILKSGEKISNSKEIKGVKQLKENVTESLYKAKPKVRKIYVNKKGSVNNFKSDNCFVKNMKIPSNNTTEKKNKEIISNNKKLDVKTNTFNLFVKNDKGYINGSKIINSMSNKEINTKQNKINNIKNNYKIKETIETKTKNKLNKEVAKTRNVKEIIIRREKLFKSIDVSKSVNFFDKSKNIIKAEKKETNEKKGEKENEKKNIVKKEEETNIIKTGKNSKKEICENKNNEKNKQEDKDIIKNEDIIKSKKTEEKPKNEPKISFIDISAKKNNSVEKLDSNKLSARKVKIITNVDDENKNWSKSKSKSRKTSNTKSLRHSQKEKDLDKLKHFKYTETRYNLNYDSSSMNPVNDKKEIKDRKNVNELKNHSTNKKKDINIYNLNYKSFEEDFRIKNLELNDSNLKPQISCRITLTKDNYIKVQGITKFFKFTYFYSENLRNFYQNDSEDNSEFCADNNNAV